MIHTADWFTHGCWTVTGQARVWSGCPKKDLVQCKLQLCNPEGRHLIAGCGLFISNGAHLIASMAVASSPCLCLARLRLRRGTGLLGLGDV